jgi:hypothetical protein
VRINVYQEEMTGEVQLVTKRDVVGDDGTPVTFYGVRIFLKGPPELHVTEFDDDRPAITFWVGDTAGAVQLAETSVELRRGAAAVWHKLGPIGNTYPTEDTA